MSKPLVAIVMGSSSDLETMQETQKLLKDFGVPFSVSILSAHRTPEPVRRFASQAQARGVKVVIAAAGMAAHLAGVVASHTLLPVIGVPMAGGSLNGLDALLSTVQMPKGVPVATMALGKAGAINAALTAVQILCLSGDADWKKLKAYREKQARAVLAESKKLA